MKVVSLPASPNPTLLKVPTRESDVNPLPHPYSCFHRLELGRTKGNVKRRQIQRDFQGRTDRAGCLQEGGGKGQRRC